MPGLTIHIAVANEYIKNYKNDIKDKNEFIEALDMCVMKGKKGIL